MPLLPVAKSISIHAPREGSDTHLHRAGGGLDAISIHAPREGSDLYPKPAEASTARISIHAPREGSDKDILSGSDLLDKFLSTLPARGATHCRIP